MVALVIRGSIFINRTAEGKLYPYRIDIPIPSNGELCSEKFDLKGNEHSIASTYRNIEQCTTSSLENREAESGRLGVLNRYENIPVKKVLRWSFSDVIHACAQAQNCALAEQLIIQVG